MSQSLAKESVVVTVLLELDVVVEDVVDMLIVLDGEVLVIALENDLLVLVAKKTEDVVTIAIE